MRRFALFLAAVLTCCLVSSLASAQQADAMLGFGTIMSSSPSQSNVQIGEKGGLYPSVSADVIFHRRVGFNYEIAWRGKQGLYGGTGGQPYRPLISDFNLVFQPRLTKKTGADLMAGIGWQSTRFYGYTNSSNCYNFGACYTSANHFLVHIGGGVRYYFFGHVFLRPEAHFYRINNNYEFSSGNIVRVGASIGYTIGPD